MKKEFSKNWKSSKQPRKQRKYLANAPMHLNKKFVSINLSPELRKKYQKRNMPVRKGDTVKIFKGNFKGKKGKVDQVVLKESKIIVEGIQVTKQDGSKANVRLEPSNLQITELNLEDGKRLNKNQSENKSTNTQQENKNQDTQKSDSKTKQTENKK